MDFKELLRLYYRMSVLRNFENLGIEKTFEVIESIKNPVYRAKLRQLHLAVLKENKEKKR